MNGYDLSSIVSFLQKKLNAPLPGANAHTSMLSFDRPTPEMAIQEGLDPKLSAVNIVLHQIDKEILFPLIKRPDYPGVHSSQIALPGGKIEKEDSSLWHTAKRETFEEIGLQQKGFQLIGELSSLYIPPSNYIVHPFISYSNEQQPEFKLDKTEVDKVILFPLEKLKDKHIKTTQKVTVFNGQYSMMVPGYTIENEFIWGATAMILKELEMMMD